MLTKKQGIFLHIFTFLCTIVITHNVFTNQPVYLPLKSVIKKHNKHIINYRWDPLDLIVKLSTKNAYIRFQIDSQIYVYNGLVYNLPYPIKYYRTQVLLPKAFAQTLISKLLKPKQAHHKPNKIYKTYRKRKRKNLDFIVIDAGHGGKDPGTSTRNNILEKKVALDIALAVASHLRSKLSKTRIILTRHKDQFISLNKRSQIANHYLGKYRKNGIFLSIHCNQHSSSKIHGFEIYFLGSRPSTSEARLVMVRENQTEKGYKYARKHEAYIINSNIARRSQMLARIFYGTFSEMLAHIVSSRSIHRADFAVMRDVAAPALLLETGYLSNPKEARTLQSKVFRKKISLAVELAVKRYMQALDKV